MCIYLNILLIVIIISIVEYIRFLYVKNKNNILEEIHTSEINNEPYSNFRLVGKTCRTYKSVGYEEKLYKLSLIKYIKYFYNEMFFYKKYINIKKYFTFKDEKYKIMFLLIIMCFLLIYLSPDILSKILQILKYVK